MNVEIPDWLIKMSEQMSTDEKRATAFPFWQVRNNVYLITEEGYNEHHWEIIDTNEGITLFHSERDDDFTELASDLYDHCDVWCQKWCDDNDFELGSEEDFINLFNENFNAEYDCDYLPGGYKKLCMQEVEEVLTTHLTKADAEWFIERKRHDYPNAYTYVASAYWSPQFKQLQDWIRALTGGKSGA